MQNVKIHCLSNENSSYLFKTILANFHLQKSRILHKNFIIIIYLAGREFNNLQ